MESTHKGVKTDNGWNQHTRELRLTMGGTNTRELRLTVGGTNTRELRLTMGGTNTREFNNG